jgi:hypothetical protein
MDLRRCRLLWCCASISCVALLNAFGHDATAGTPARSLGVIALAAIGWSMIVHPPVDDPLVRRAIHPWVPTALATVVLGLVPLVPLASTRRDDVAGLLAATLLLLTYLVTWGHRSPARMRWTLAMCVLVVPSVAAPVYDAFESSNRVVSELVYRRLGTISGLHVQEEPWKLFSAMPYSGSVLALTLLVLGTAVCVTRGLSLLPTLVAVTGTTLAALVAHHVLVLLLPLDDYSPGTAVRVVTSPLSEIAAAIVAVVLMSASLSVRLRHERGDRRAAEPAEYVDPMIYAVVDRSRRVPVGGITVGMSALALVAAGANVL